MKYICLDTETTGLYAKNDRIIEIGCIDITNGIKNKKIFHQYINPEQNISEESKKIHGLTLEFLESYKTFKEYAQEFLTFIKDATLIIHNSIFDLRFINAELNRINLPPLNNPIIDTLKIARNKFPGKKATLDALKERFYIQIERNLHGALLDAEILAHIYFELIKTQDKLDLKELIINKKEISPSKKKLTLTIEENEIDQSFFKDNP